MFAGIVAIVCALGPPLLALLKSSNDVKKLTTSRLRDEGVKLAWQVVEGMKRVGPALTPDQAIAAAEKELLAWAVGKGLKLDACQIAAAKVAWRQLSTAAKASATKKK